MKRSFLNLIFTSLLAAFVSGCASSPRDTDARALAVKAFGSDKHLRIEWFAHNWSDELAMGRPDTGPERQILHDLLAAKHKHINLIVWSEADSVAATATLRVIQHHPEVQSGLQSLNYLYVGDIADGERLRPIIEASGARFYFHQR